jgi:hypothetical protein
MDLSRLIISASEIAQKCQRNWNLDINIDDDIINTLKTVIKNSPTKQNEECYSVEFVTDRSVIEEIYQHTSYDTTVDSDKTKNPQTLANLLVIFYSAVPNTFRNPKHEYANQSLLTQNSCVGIGIASGQTALAAAMLGLKTGFCACFDGHQLSTILNGKRPDLILGIGYPDKTKNRLEHHKIKSFSRSYSKPLKIYHNGEVDELSGIKPTVKVEYFPPSSITLDSGMPVTSEDVDQFQSLVVDIAQKLDLILFGMDLIADDEQHNFTLSFSAEDIVKLEMFKNELINDPFIKELHRDLENQHWVLKF